MSIKVGVKVTGDPGVTFNGVRLTTREEATKYADDLYSRWTLMTGYDLVESEEPVNYVWTSDGLKYIEPAANKSEI